MFAGLWTDLSNKLDSKLFHVKLPGNIRGLTTRHSNSLGNIFLAEEGGRAERRALTKQNLIFLIHHQLQCCCINISEIPDHSAIVIVYICWEPGRAGDGTKNRSPANTRAREGESCGREDADCGQRTVLTHSRCTV